MIADPCLMPAANCNQWDLQSPDMAKFLLIQLLNSLLNSPLELSALKSLAAAYRCQGSPAKIQALWTASIISGLRGVETAQPVCWTPNELEGALAYLVCKLAGGSQLPV